MKTLLKGKYNKFIAKVELKKGKYKRKSKIKKVWKHNQHEYIKKIIIYKTNSRTNNVWENEKTIH